MVKIFPTILISLVLLGGCKSVPLSNRNQLNFMGNRQLFPMSFDQYQQVKNQSTIVTGTPEAQMVKQSGARIQKAVEQYFMDLGQPDYLNEYEWEFNLIAEETINAWCMPGGKVAFYSGIMPICQDELGVAVVMGHEIAHAIANHGAERMSQQYAAQTGLTLANILLGNDQNESVGKNLLLQAAGVGTSLGILAFSRKHESEADQLGLYFMAMAGYDPREAPKFWERMASASGGAAPPEFLSTHPSDSRRIRDLQANMETALQYYESSQ